MEFTNKIFLETFDKVQDKVNCFADRNPLCSDIPVELTVKGELTRAKDVLGLLLVLPLVVPSTRNYDIIATLREQLWNTAWRNKLEGQWYTVAQILQHSDSLSVYQTWEVVMRHCSSQDWFGNIVPLMCNTLKRLTYKPKYAFDSESTAPVNKPQRKRGYNDKGSRRDNNALAWFIPDDPEEIVVEFHYKQPPGRMYFGYLERGRS